MQPLTATTANPPEDIEAVLSRFQVWSDSRKASTPPKAKDLPAGVRELSYEEALESSRYRWQTRLQPSVDNEPTEEFQSTAEEKPTTAVTQDNPAHPALNDEAIFVRYSEPPLARRPQPKTSPKHSPLHQHSEPHSPKPSPPNPIPARLTLRA